MIYLLYGDDSYRSWHKLQSIKQKYLTSSQGDTDLVVLEGSESTAEQLNRQIQTLPFLATTRLVIIKNLLKEGKKEVQEGIIDTLSNVPKSTVLFFYEAGQPDKRLKLFQTLNKPKQAQEFTALADQALVTELHRMADAQELSVPMPVLRLLAQHLGSDLWRAEQEIRKLALYAQATEQPITEEIVRQLVTSGQEVAIFSLTDAFGNRQSKAALVQLALADSDGALGLLSIIAGQYRNLIMVSLGQKQQLNKQELATRLKLHPFVVEKTMQQARHYTYEELLKCYRYLLELDFAVKLSIIEPIAGLSVLAASLAEKNIQLPSLIEEPVLEVA